LKLVFINGCESQNFVSGLKNVPIVIGTSKKIIDSYAFESATKFYQAIENKPDKFKTAEGIEELFKEARQLKDMNSDEAEKWENTVKRGGDDDDDDTDAPTKDVYAFKINKDAPNFAIRVTYNLNPEEKDVNKEYFDLNEKIRSTLGISEIGEGELHKSYPYLFSSHLEKLKPELEKEAGFVSPKNIESLTTEYSKLSMKRSLKIVGLHSQFITFLKYCGCSMLWTLHRRKKLDMQSFSPDEKKAIKFNLSYDYSGANIGPDKIEAVGQMYSMIPEELISENAVWINLKKLVHEKQDVFKEMATLFHSFKSEDERKNVGNWIKTEGYLIDFIENEAFSFLRNLSIWSVYDINFRQFRFKDDKELVFTKGHYPIATRPMQGKSELTKILLEANTEIDYDIQSVYLMEGENRILNLTPFYIDMNASDENANKMEICFLEKYPDSQADIKLKYISLKDEQQHNIGEEEENDDQKKTFEQMKYFWSLISDNG
jgi:hypothetical protein